MELILHDITELQRLIDELATSSSGLPRSTYAQECDQFFDRIEAYITSGDLENEDYLSAKLSEIRAYVKNLLKPTHQETDLSVYQAMANNALNVVYRNIRNPMVTPWDELPLE